MLSVDNGFFLYVTTNYFSLYLLWAFITKLNETPTALQVIVICMC